MSSIPRDKVFDSTLSLLFSDGAAFLEKRHRYHHADAFETRLMLRRTFCVKGEDATRMFYEPDRFTRRGALPLTALLLLQDVGSVATLDGWRHRHRKAMFMSMMSAERMQRLVDGFSGVWQNHLEQWKHREAMVLHGEVQKILCEAVCAWSGVPLLESDVGKRTKEFAAMIHGAGTVGPVNWRAQLLRVRTERWIREVIARIRAGALEAPEMSAAHLVAWHRDREGMLLDEKIAAVELINVLRPTVAVARFVTFAALALHEHPEQQEELARGGDEYLGWFVQEVRRFYPFFPFVGGRVLQTFEWRGRSFEPGTRFLLDLYGTDHDERIWDEPQTFLPERFRDWDGGAFNFIPQGGGDHFTGHRCAGEWITIRLMEKAVGLLTESMSYEVPEQDLRVKLSKMPPLPESGFVIRNVRGTT